MLIQFKEKSKHISGLKNSHIDSWLICLAVMSQERLGMLIKCNVMLTFVPSNHDF